MQISIWYQTSWLKAFGRGCGLLFAALVVLWSSPAWSQATVTLLPTTIPSGTENSLYTQTITAAGGVGPYSYAVTSGSLPAGLSLTAGGVLSGTPSASSSGTFTITATDLGGPNSGFRPYTFSIGQNGGGVIDINPGSLPDGTRGVAYSQTITASSGSGGYAFSISAGSLPNGLSIGSSSGTISGTPTAGGTFNFTVRVRDSDGNVDTKPYSINIIVPIIVAPSSLPNGTVGTAYSQTVTASGGTAPYTFAISAGSLPTGLSLSSGGAITGTPTAAGTYSFTVRATDAGASTGTRAYSVTINLAPITISPSSLPAGTVGTAYSQSVTASGGTAAYSYDVLSGSLPPGLSLNSSTGAITGTPTAGGAYTFTVQATDATPNTGTRSYTLNIGTNSLALAPTSLPNGTQGLSYSQTVTASGGTAPYTYAVTSGALPTGLSLSSGGAITGTPTAGGSYGFTVTATDSVGNVGSQAYSVNIGTNTLTVNPASLPAGTRSVAYSQTVSAASGTGPYTFAISAGALPAGLSLNASTGVISGTPTGLGTSSFTVRAIDTLGAFGTRAYSVNIGTVTLTVSPSSLTPAVVGRPYTQTVTATGGTAPYTFSVSAGPLPSGLSLNTATGVISGTPTALVTSTFTIQALDVNGNTGSRAYTLTNRPDPALDPEVIGLINAQVAAARRFAFAQSDNIMRHMEGLHDRFEPCSFQFGVTLPAGDKAQPYPGASPYSASPGAAARSYEPAVNSPAAQVARRTPASPECFDGGWVSSLAAWVSGAVEFGKMSPSGLTTDNKFSTSGLTAGIDWRANDRLIVGIAVGYGADRTDVGSNGSRSDATSFSGSLYASYQVFNPVFIDGSIGYGTLGYDSRRWVADSAAIATGSRKGSYWFGSAAASLEVKHGALKLAPYVRADYMSAHLDGYAEQGPSQELLTFGAMDFRSVSGSLGLRGSYDIPTVWGVLTPLARIEYRQAIDGAFQQSMYYSDLGSSITSVLDQSSAIRAMVNTSVGLRARALGGMTALVEYGTSSSGGALQSQSLRGSLKLPF